MLEKVIPTNTKLELIEALSQTGVTSIEATSFVRPDLVPQMADAAEIAAQLKRHGGVHYHALYLNQKGLIRAANTNAFNLEGEIMLAASEKFLKKNNNLSVQEALEGIPAWIALFREQQLKVDRIMFSTAFGDNFEGPIPAEQVLAICRQAIDEINSEGERLGEITFADTTGWANPESVRRLVGEFRSLFPEVHVALHFHDTRGTGMANVYAGLQMGVSRFDCSVGGLGGCPFAKGAAGNVPTEDVAFMCEELGIRTGVNLERYIECAKLAEHIAGFPLPGKLKNGGLLVGSH